MESGRVASMGVQGTSNWLAIFWRRGSERAAMAT